MNSRWSDTEAESFAARYAKKGVSRDLALRVYTTRLLGQDPRLVLHGGGNSSVKTVMRDLLGEDVAVLCVKGSGWDMGNIEPAGLPAISRRRSPSVSSASEAGEFSAIPVTVKSR